MYAQDKSSRLKKIKIKYGDNQYANTKPMYRL